jgi:hypothetical protein
MQFMSQRQRFKFSLFGCTDDKGDVCVAKNKEKKFNFTREKT